MTDRNSNKREHSISRDPETVRQGYEAMATDVEAEAEAMEWCEGFIEEGWNPEVSRELRAAFDEWSWLFDTEMFRVCEHSPFADLILESNKAELWLLEVNSGELRRYSDEPEERARLFFEELVGKLRSHGLVLGEGQCYALKPHAIFKPYFPGNVYVGNLSEYVSFMSSFHRQIKDLPDGTTIRFVVKPEPQESAAQKAAK